jgi:hypothetical protein
MVTWDLNEQVYENVRRTGPAEPSPDALHLVFISFPLKAELLIRDVTLTDRTTDGSYGGFDVLMNMI